MGFTSGGEKSTSSTVEMEKESIISNEPAPMGAWKAYWRVFKYAQTTDLIMIGIAGIAACASGVGIASQNIIFGKFVTEFTDFDTGNAAADSLRSSSATLALYFFLLGVGRMVMAYIYNFLLTFSAYRIVRNIRHAYLKAALRQEVAYFDLGTSGSIATQAYSNGRLVQAGIAEKLGLTIQGLSAFFSSFVIAFVTNWKLTLIICCIAPLTVGVMIGCAFIEAGYEAKILERYADANSFAEGVIASIRTVHAFDMRAELVNRFDGFLVQAHRYGKKISPLFGILFSAEYTIIYLGNALAFWRGIHMLASGEIANTGDVFTVLMSVVIAALSITQLAPHSIEFTRAASAAAQLYVVIDRKTAIDPMDPSGEVPTSITGDVELENVVFAYPTRPDVTVLKSFSLRAPAGKVTALVGHSGSGKSTIVGLLQRWYNPASGTIKLDGRSIDSLNISWLRRNVRLVQQEPVLFRGSVFDNIANGLYGTDLEKASKEEQMKHVVAAAKTAYAHDFIEQLPHGYDTEIGQRGGLLSGGQKQRIAIARSLVSNPRVLLLDEATSALDPHAEGIVQQALDQASAGRTTIVIAHKLATVRNAHNIVVMSKGEIVEQGTHNELLAMKGAYSRLVTIQQLTVEGEDSPEGTEVEVSDEKSLKEDPEDKEAAIYRSTTNAASIRTQAGAGRYSDEGTNQLGLLATIWRLIYETPDLKWAYLAMFSGCFLSAGLFPGQAILMAYMIDVFTLTGKEMTDEGNFFAAMFVALAGACLFSYYAMGWGTNTLAQALAHNLRKQIFNDILRQDIEYFDRSENNIGALTSRIDAYPQAVFELMGFNIGFILIAGLSIIICSILGIVYAWKLGLVIVLAGTPAVIGFGWIKMILDGRLDRLVAKRLSTSSAIASESTTAIRTVSSLGIERAILDRYTFELDQVVKGSRQPLLFVMFWFALTQASEYWFMALGFWYGCRLVAAREITIFDFFVSYMAVFFCAQSTSQIFQFSTSITKGKNGANAIFWLKQIQPVVQETPENKDNSPDPEGSLQLAETSFAYPLRPHAPVLKNINLEARRGQFIALVGASGCGKSTIISMLERFYDPSSGAVLLGSQDLTTINPRKYRAQVGLVQQEPTLFQGTIRENIALGISNPTANTILDSGAVSDADIERALRAANAWDFVSSLPEGVNTAAGPNGTQLSGGQRQRIAIARALIRNPRILLLDEATSALDTESEKIVQNALAEAANDGDRITVAVAHRLSTIKDADVICVFYGGRIVEQGTHAELLTGSGTLYKKMCEAQSLA
ncbi:hypothetical protein COCCADRAFT_997 [Bipolaris zeicola 26-R-13]|uniref:Uncharacterized protein n=1 Tax=Cochliobolus carbonum (strain 26-R-13) TaxID=930089 RepID=W6YKI2_COCC2|nr:uncharacterized protein COCCADRAFT_997 [Bipolaris zeicola 26-R-13]EUC38190.1 hypothetical protein COCCADRAFT_997 [Bipolaris zeicola 26-R-13]